MTLTGNLEAVDMNAWSTTHIVKGGNQRTKLPINLRRSSYFKDNDLTFASVVTDMKEVCCFVVWLVDG